MSCFGIHKTGPLILAVFGRVQSHLTSTDFKMSEVMALVRVLGFRVASGTFPVTASAEAVFHRHSLRLGCGSMAREEAGTVLKFRLVGAGPEATCEQDDCHLRKGELEKHHWSTTKCTWWLPNQYRTRLQTMPLSQNLHETAVKKALRP